MTTDLKVGDRVFVSTILPGGAYGTIAKFTPLGVFIRLDDPPPGCCFTHLTADCSGLQKLAKPLPAWAAR